MRIEDLKLSSFCSAFFIQKKWPLIKKMPAKVIKAEKEDKMALYNLQ